MSLSNPDERVSNPAEIFLEWQGKKANLYYYDKDKKENVKLALPFKMIVLDQLACISGFSDQANSNIYSNQVRNTKTEKLHVKTYKGGYSWEGLYEKLKLDVKSFGGKFTKSIYVAIRLPTSKDFIIANLKLRGGSQYEWSEFCNKNKEHIAKVGGVSITGFKEEKKGDNTYYIPTFQIEPVSQQSTRETAIEMDKKLQVYLKQHLNGVPSIEDSQSNEEQDNLNDYPVPNDEVNLPSEHVDDLPF